MKKLLSFFLCFILSISLLGCIEPIDSSYTSDTSTSESVTSAIESVASNDVISQNPLLTLSQITIPSIPQTPLSVPSDIIVTTPEIDITVSFPISSDASSEQNTSESVVYTTPTGKRYHLDPDCGGKNSRPNTLENAKRAGLTPCQKCAQ